MESDLNGRVEFGFVSNRPMNSDLMEAIEDAALETSSRHPKDLKKLEDFTSLTGEKLSAFCRLLNLKVGTRVTGSSELPWLRKPKPISQVTMLTLPFSSKSW